MGFTQGYRSWGPYTGHGGGCHAGGRGSYAGCHGGGGRRTRGWAAGRGGRGGSGGRFNLESHGSATTANASTDAAVNSAAGGSGVASTGLRIGKGR
jgi:hypothetical protein